MSVIILAVRGQDSGDRIQETGDRRQDSGDYFLFILPTPHFPTSPLPHTPHPTPYTPHPTPHTPHPTTPLPHFPIPFKQDLVLLLKSSFLLTD
ncbi:hypothetical protein [Microcystis aeruginosa]|uniref:hypothetical protein n=1 Tax=Microcystis aeruginosa TaxID=1126 RepID=UPI000934E726|nr:hypothetical protein [Microcystis aeruginosa]